MKKFRWMYIIISIFIILHTCIDSNIGNNCTYYINCGQAIIENDRRFFKVIDSNVTKESFKYSTSINIIEKILTMQLLFFIMFYSIKSSNLKSYLVPF